MRPGLQIAPWRDCAIGDEPPLYWLRGLLERTPGVTRPPVRGLFLNTVLARQSLTLKDEILGSGTGLPSQRLHCTRAPILGEVHLEVREPEPPPSEVLSRLRRVLGTEPVRLLRDDRDRITECWVRWQEVEDFYSSTQEDRHFTVDRQRGLIQFGDGVRGCTPPSGTNSIVLRRYAVGGGAVGNLPAGSITKLRTTVPFVDSVANRVASVGGCDIESWDALRDRGSRRLRHRYRAVTAEDYEDLARLASPAVARTRCYPARDLRRHRGSPSDCPGVVSLIVIPHGEEPAPRPDLALQRLVWDFLSPYRLPDTRLLVCGVEYLAIGVEVEVEVSADAAWRTVVEDCTRSLRRFLHPLTGGVHGHGWPFGRRPHRSDFFPVLESIPGLEYVHTLELVFPPQLTELMQSGAFLVCSGEHRIRLVDGTARQPGKGDSYHAS
jgi:predicted phage baseplate assembly protein